MKNLLIALFLFIGIISFAQKKDCKIDFEEKTDSTYIKKTVEVLVHERVFGNNKEMIFFSLLVSDGVPMLGFQQIQKSTEFIPAICFDKNSKIIFQLVNGKIITLINSSQENCSSLSYDAETKSNIKVMTNYFLFLKDNYDELLKSPISLMRISFVGERKDIAIKNKIDSELLKSSSTPATYFIDYLHCVEE
jgi:hypothetical protein